MKKVDMMMLARLPNNECNHLNGQTGEGKFLACNIRKSDRIFFSYFFKPLNFTILKEIFLPSGKNIKK